MLWLNNKNEVFQRVTYKKKLLNITHQKFLGSNLWPSIQAMIVCWPSTVFPYTCSRNIRTRVQRSMISQIMAAMHKCICYRNHIILLRFPWETCVPCRLHWDSAPSRKHWALHHRRLSRTGGRSLPRKTEDRSLPFGGDRNGMKPASVGRRTVPDPDLHARWSEPAGTGCASLFRQN